MKVEPSPAVQRIIDAVASEPGYTIHHYAARLGLTYQYAAELLGRAYYMGHLWRRKSPYGFDRRLRFYFPMREADSL